MRFIVSILTFLVIQISFGQQDYCDVTIDKTFVGQNERFTYQVLTNLDCPISLPDFTSLGIEIVGGPISGSTSYYESINGVSKQRTEYYLTYYLIATKKGSIIIPPASVECRGKKISTNKSSPTKINVGEGVPTNQTGAKTHFLTATANKSSVYLGEPFVVQLKFYSNKKPEQIGSIDLGEMTPMYRDNLFKEKQNYTITEELVKGEHYYVIELYRDLCIPISAGKAELAPYYASINIGRDFFSNKWIEGVSEKVEVNVKDLPKNRPENFNGLVGDFSMTHSINKTELSIGEVIDLEIKIEGVGNFNAFDDPVLNFPKEFHVFDPEIERSFKSTENGIEGKITYHYVVSPDESGRYIIPPFNFSYFDLDEKRYKSLTTEKFEINVKKGSETYIVDNGTHVDPINNDINYIHTKGHSFFKSNDFIYGSFTYWSLISIPLLVSWILILIGLRIKNRSDEKIVENQQKVAKKSVFKEIDAARKLIKNGDEKGALKLVKNAVENYFMIKLNLSLSALSKQTIHSKLSENGIDETTLNEFGINWTNIEMTQYSPVSGKDLGQIIDDSENLIKKINTQL